MIVSIYNVDYTCIIEYKYQLNMYCLFTFILIILNNDKIESAIYTDTLSGEEKIIKTSAIILAVGHSAVDVYKLLKENFGILPKIRVRIHSASPLKVFFSIIT